VELVEHHDRDRLEERVALEHPQQDPLGDHPDPRTGTHAPVEPHLIADLVAKLSAPLESHTPGTRPGGQPPRL